MLLIIVDCITSILCWLIPKIGFWNKSIGYRVQMIMMVVDK